MKPSEVNLVRDLVQVANSLYGKNIYVCRNIFDSQGNPYGVLISCDSYVRDGEALRSLLNLLATIGGDASGMCVEIFDTKTYRVF